ncbi:MAG: GGDEF domain-containing protein [Chitinivibrionia bacterium]|nr:GGDEF domain-containing protein [Chitinivibrionia bacterium]
MEIDLFENEQRIYDDALERMAKTSDDRNICIENYGVIVKEYGKLLKQLRRATRVADRTTINLHESNLSLTDKVNVDVLTGLYNRRYMEERMRSLIGTLARANGGLLSVMMMDVDNFKKYNDTYGHAAGDVCLQSIADALMASVTRTDDFVARYGGEEFVVVLPNTDEGGARKIAEMILQNVMAKNILHEKNEAGVATISIGITTARVEHTQSGQDYIKRADEALYISKDKGRNRYTYITFKEENV